MGVFGGYDLVRLRGAYLEVDLDDMRPENRLLEVLGIYGQLQLHLPSTKLKMHYLVDLQKIIRLSEMGNRISHRNQTTRANTDTRTSPRTFYEPTHNRQMSTHEMGGLGRLMISRGAYVTWGFKTRRTNGRFYNGIGIVNPRASRRKKFRGYLRNFGFFIG